MSYSNCRQGGAHEDCNGYVGPLDSYACHCPCHQRDERGCIVRNPQEGGSV